MSPDEELSYRDRIVAYMLKAMREAKVYTSWLNPSEAHERAMVRFVETVLSLDNAAFRADFLPLHAIVARYGMYNSLAQLAIKTCAPGVPDFYQGSELWDLTLVDPDNRRPVDYHRRRALLAALDDECARDGRGQVAARLLERRDDGLKLFTTTTLLRIRRDHRDILADGDYNPVDVRGSQQDHVFAFSRTSPTGQIVLAVPRLMASLTPDIDVAPLGERVWGDTHLALSGGGGWHDLMTDCCVPQTESGTVRAADVFRRFPVAVLAKRHE
jgi:(1->4)-alpha-D-glucan 1-alpha-D-glucosylmutase